MFAFPTLAIDASAYAVTVKTQPTAKSQTCAIPNGTGTVEGADVTNVSVVCTTNEYSVGGTLSGLGSGSVVLTNNGVDDLSRSSDGSFHIRHDARERLDVCGRGQDEACGLFVQRHRRNRDGHVGSDQ